MLNENKETPLITAINNKAIECAESMIKLGFDINIRSKEDLNPLMLTPKIGNQKLFELLLNKAAIINDKNILGETSISQSHIMMNYQCLFCKKQKEIQK